MITLHEKTLVRNYKQSMSEWMSRGSNGSYIEEPWLVCPALTSYSSSNPTFSSSAITVSLASSSVPSSPHHHRISIIIIIMACLSSIDFLLVLQSRLPLLSPYSAIIGSFTSSLAKERCHQPVCSYLKLMLKAEEH